MTRLRSIGAVLLVLALTTTVATQRGGPARDITKVTGDLYRARNGAWATIVFVTPDGIILHLAEGADGPALHGAGAIRRLQPQSF